MTLKIHLLLLALAFPTGCQYDFETEGGSSTVGTESTSTPTTSTGSADELDTSASATSGDLPGATTGGDESTGAPPEDSPCDPPELSEAVGVFVRPGPLESGGDGSYVFPFATLPDALAQLHLENEVVPGRAYIFLCKGDPLVLNAGDPGLQIDQAILGDRRCGL